MRADEVSAPQTLNDAVAVFKRWPEAIAWAGGTLLYRQAAMDNSKTPVSIIDLGHIHELKTIMRTDRYLELGACVCLADILDLPATLSLEPLRTAVGKIGSATIRNMATIGGNLAAKDFFMTCFAPLLCMDAAIEIRDKNGARWAGMQNFINQDGRPAFPSASILSRIRIPIRNWNATAIKVMGNMEAGEPCPATFAASARVEKDILSEARLILAGKRLARDRNLELALAGKRLPLTARDLDMAKQNGFLAARAAGFSEDKARRFSAYLEAFLGVSLEAGI